MARTRRALRQGEGDGTKPPREPQSHPATFGPETLREYALLADGERGAIIGPHGDIVWMCFPSWSDEAAFCSLVGGAGGYSITPAERHVWGGYYEPNTLVWTSRWVTTRSIIECHEALAFPGEEERAVILRQLEAVSGEARVALRLDVAPFFGTRRVRDWRRSEDGAWTGSAGSLYLRWAGAPQATVTEDGAALTLELTLAQGQKHDLVLELSTRPFERPLASPGLLWESTEAAWRKDMPRLERSVARRDAAHAYAVIRGLTSRSGAMVAAVTTSLPERAESGRNYDYRYAWIRDACYAGIALSAAGGCSLLDRILQFVCERVLADGPLLAPLYTVSGGQVSLQTKVDLPGFPGGDLVIVGNDAAKTFQLDVFGEALLLFAAAAQRGRLNAEGWRAARVAGEAIAKRWSEPDSGVWEIEPRWWAHSRLVCAAGLRQMAARGAPPELANRWLALADAIVAATSERCLHPGGRWQRAPNDARVDAALLTAGFRGALPRGDPRTAATLAAVLSGLTEDGYAYRYRVDERPLGKAEGAFLLCGFWLCLALLDEGDRLSAFRWFERNRAACGPPGIFTEEFDVQQRQSRSNFPQAFVHALLLECASRLGADGPEER